MLVASEVEFYLVIQFSRLSYPGGMWALLQVLFLIMQDILLGQHQENILLDYDLTHSFSKRPEERLIS